MSTFRAHAASCELIACGILLVALAGCGAEEPPPELPPRAIQWQRVSSSLAGQQRMISGIVTAVDETELAFEVGGNVLTVEVNLGDIVEQGQVLARLDPEPLQLAVVEAESGLAQAVALREEARASQARYEEARGAVSEQQIDRARALRESRESQVEATQARLNLARRDLRRSVLKSPFRGAISSREIDPARQVAVGQTAFKMDSAEGGLRVEVQMPETLIARVRQGDEVEVGFPSVGGASPDLEGRRFAAVVSDVGTRARVGNAFPVRADLLDPPNGLRPGMTAEVSFAIAPGDQGVAGLEGSMIPFAAILAEADDRFSVFVYDDGSSTVTKTSVLTGGVRDNDIAILEGLSDGDVIATAGVSFLRDGQKVTLLDEQLMQIAP